MAHFRGFVLLAAALATLFANTVAALPNTKAGTAEQRASKAMLDAQRSSPLDLHAFLEKMPKGGDLHNHLTGAIFAETWIAESAADHLCVNPTSTP